MNSIIDKILKDIQKFDENLYQKIIKNNVSEEIILENINKIYRHLNDLEDETLIVRKQLDVVNEKFVQKTIYSSVGNQVNLDEKIKQNFVLNYGGENLNYIDNDSLLNDLNLIIEKIESKNNNGYNLIINYHRNLIYLIKQNKIIFSKTNFVLLLDTQYNEMSFPIRLSKIIFSILNEYAINNFKVAFISMPVFFAETKLSFNNFKNIISKAFETSKLVDVLFLENLSSLFMKEWFISDYLLPILNYRELNSKKTFISINTSLDEFLNELNNLNLSNSIKKDIILFFQKMKFFDFNQFDQFQK